MAEESAEAVVAAEATEHGDAAAEATEEMQQRKPRKKNLFPMKLRNTGTSLELMVGLLSG